MWYRESVAPFDISNDLACDEQTTIHKRMRDASCTIALTQVLLTEQSSVCVEDGRMQQLIDRTTWLRVTTKAARVKSNMVDRLSTGQM